MTMQALALEPVQVEPKPDGATCEYCGEPFAPREHSGGKPQKYCGETCRRAADNARQSQRGQRGGQRGEDAAAPIPEIIGTVLKNGGGESLFVPEAELRRVDAMADESPDDSEQFDWSKHDEDILLAEQAMTAAYLNPKGGLVIRQCCWPNDDHFVIIQPGNVAAFLDKLCDVVGIPGAGQRP